MGIYKLLLKIVAGLANSASTEWGGSSNKPYRDPLNSVVPIDDKADESYDALVSRAYKNPNESPTRQWAPMIGEDD